MGYIVLVWIASSNTNPFNATVGPTDTDTVVVGLTDGESYYFEVCAFNLYGTGDASNASDTVTPEAINGVPGVPCLMYCNCAV